MITRIRNSALSVAALAAGLALSAPAAQADAVADFYKGSTINLIISTGVGGSNDLNARILLRHMVNFIPGKPDQVAKNMPGAGHVRAANFLYNVAPKDGTAIGALVRFYVLHQALGGKGVKYDATKFNYLGSTATSNVVVGAWHTAGVSTIAEARKKEVIMGGTGVGSGTVIFPSIFNALIGTKFKIVQGYKSGHTIDLAMQRGEVFGRAGFTFDSLKSISPDWIPSGKFKVIAQVGLKKEPGYEHIPLATEFVKSEEDRKVLEMYSGVVAVGSPIFTTPGVPQARLAALRKAFDQTMTDKAFLEEIKKARLEIKPTSAAEEARIVSDIVNAPANIIQRAREAVKNKNLIKCTAFTQAKFCRKLRKRKKG